MPASLLAVHRWTTNNHIESLKENVHLAAEKWRQNTLLDLERNIMSHACDKLQNLRYLYFSNNISSVWEDSFLGFGKSLRARSLIRLFLRATVSMSQTSPTSTLSTTTLPPLPGGAHIQEKS